jgi:hypothetical protein
MNIFRTNFSKTNQKHFRLKQLRKQTIFMHGDTDFYRDAEAGLPEMT